MTSKRLALTKICMMEGLLVCTVCDATEKLIHDQSADSNNKKEATRCIEGMTGTSVDIPVGHPAR